MWMLSFIPDSFLIYVVNLILLAGAVGSVLFFFVLHRILRWFPALSPYYLLLQIISAALLVIGIYLKGGYSVEMSWREKVRIAEEKARLAEQQAAELNAKLNDEVKKKQKVIVENKIVYQDRIREVAKVIDKECKVAPEAIDIHNAAAKNKSLEKKQ